MYMRLSDMASGQKSQHCPKDFALELGRNFSSENLASLGIIFRHGNQIPLLVQATGMSRLYLPSSDSDLEPDEIPCM